MPKSQSPDRQTGADVAPNDPVLQGEGNYTAARRHRKSVKQFIESGQVDGAARTAAPKDAGQERELKQAEEAGLKRARK